jgi:hypothetical protein
VSEAAIRLNFYSVIPAEFEFPVWRSPYDGFSSPMSEYLYRAKLPVEKGIDDWREYKISFTPVADYEKFCCKSNDNVRLTTNYLFNLIKKKAAKFDASQYQLNGKFRKTISFVLASYREGKQVVWLEPYYFSPHKKFGFLIDFRFQKDRSIPFSREVQRLSLSLDSMYRSNKNFYIDKYAKVQEFLSQYKSKIFPLVTEEGTQLTIASELEELNSKVLKPKEYVFNNGHTAASQFKGITDFGPHIPLAKEVVMVYIYQENDRYLAEDLENALHGKLPWVAFKGIEAVFRMHVNDRTDIKLTNLEKSELERAVHTIREIKTLKQDYLIMPILIGDINDDQAYFFMKYEMLKEGLPLQVVTNQLLKKRDTLKWSVSNIALQIFSKLGGTAWKVAANNGNSIIFGIGQAHQKIDGRIVKYFAYSVCTDSTGIYKKIRILGKSQNENDYLSQLKTNILCTLKEYLTEGYTSFVIHIPFKIKKREIESIYQGITQIKSSSTNQINLVVLRVNSYNKFFGYASTNSLIPNESSYVVVSHKPKGYLVWFEGLLPQKESIYKRVAGPVHIEFYWSNNDLDERERLQYVQSVLNLSGANWRGFNSTNLPISIYYCELIAGILTSFPEETENIEKVVNPWFL